jgi:transcriptional regulator with XRE-family HTH domain
MSDNKPRKRSLAARALLGCCYKQGVSLNEISRRTGVYRGNITALVNQGTDPRFSNVEKFAKALGLKPHEFLNPDNWGSKPK